MSKFEKKSRIKSPNCTVQFTELKQVYILRKVLYSIRYIPETSGDECEGLIKKAQRAFQFRAGSRAQGAYQIRAI